MATKVQSQNGWRRRLVPPAYSLAEAARYAKAPAPTISSWFNRETRLGPALAGREKGRPLSYLELVEVAFVATARRLGIDLSEIRNTRNYFRQRFQAEFPFATYRFQTEGINLLLDLQEVDPTADREKFILGGRDGQSDASGLRMTSNYPVTLRACEHLFLPPLWGKVRACTELAEVMGGARSRPSSYTPTVCAILPHQGGGKTHKL